MGAGEIRLNPLIRGTVLRQATIQDSRYWINPSQSPDSGNGLATGINEDDAEQDWVESQSPDSGNGLATLVTAAVAREVPVRVSIP